MLRIGVTIPSSQATTDQMRRAWRMADGLGVDAIFVSDHFFPGLGDPDGAQFECFTLLSAIAENTEFAELGSLVVAPAFRNPSLLAHMAKTIDHLSGGRLILGMGAGGSVRRDYDECGYEYGTAGSRLRELEQAVQGVKEAWKLLRPEPTRRIPLLIGGGGEKVTLRIVAEHADIWHMARDLDTLQQKARRLEEWCGVVGRDASTIERAAHITPPLRSEIEPQALLEAGFTFLILRIEPPYRFDRLVPLLAWRDSVRAAA